MQIKEGRDHYANITVAHLLMILEHHRGPVFLTSNLRGNMDDAYTRRFAVIVEFKNPDKALRRQIWRAQCALYAIETPEAEDLAELAASVDLTAAEIANIMHFAQAITTQTRTQFDAGLLAKAIYRERAKSTLSFAPSDLRALTPFLDAAL